MSISENRGSSKVQRPAMDWDDETEPDQNTPIKALTREEVEVLRAKYPPLSPWRVVAVQAVFGGVIALLWWIFTGQGTKALSALCGVAAVVLPNALMARGMTKLFGGVPGAAALGFMFWELIKIMLTIALLVAAAKWMPDLSWPAMLVALIGCLKVNWLALLWQGRMSRNGN